ncbi:MAG: hypothetical protein V7646_2665 [Pseudonocardia sp.]|jgi:hypothetical protein
MHPAQLALHPQTGFVEVHDLGRSDRTAHQLTEPVQAGCGAPGDRGDRATGHLRRDRNIDMTRK